MWSLNHLLVGFLNLGHTFFLQCYLLKKLLTLVRIGQFSLQNLNSLLEFLSLCLNWFLWLGFHSFKGRKLVFQLTDGGIFLRELLLDLHEHRFDHKQLLTMACILFISLE